MRLPLTVIRPGELTVDRREVMRLLGYREGRTRVDQRHLDLVDRGIAIACATANPVASVAHCAVSVAGDEVSTAVPGLTWRSRSLARLLREAFALSLVAATLGPGVERQAEALFAGEEYSLATIVDAAGSALIQALAAHVRAQIPAEMTPLYGPGYGDWPIQDQIALTEAAGGAAIGLRCTETCYLTPQKSLVGIVGWLAPRGEQRPPASGCGLCTMPDCAYRIRPARGGSAP